MELDNTEAIKNVVASGLGISIIPGDAIGGAPAERRLAVRPLRPALGYELVLVHRRDKPLDDAMRIVLAALQSLVGRAKSAR
jgi:DNA-binding transcriptional LysR family regulator